MILNLNLNVASTRTINFTPLNIIPTSLAVSLLEPLNNAAMVRYGKLKIGASLTLQRRQKIRCEDHIGFAILLEPGMTIFKFMPKVIERGTTQYLRLSDQER